MDSQDGSIVLSTMEFDMLWEAERLPLRHVALDVPSPGVTHAERAELVDQAWTSLEARQLAWRRKPAMELVDMLNLFAHPERSIDVWVWAEKETKGLAASSGGQAALGVVDGDEVSLTPVRDTSLVEAAVSIAGNIGRGVGQAVSLQRDVLMRADAEVRGDARAMVTALADQGVNMWQAQEIAGMLIGMVARGQFGVEYRTRDRRIHRADRVIAFHDTDAGRYLCAQEPGSDGRGWTTIAPADNQLLAQRIRELLESNGSSAPG